MRPLPVLLLTVLLGAAGSAGAQTRLGADYYFDRSDATLMQQLSNVERFHLPGCSDAANSRQYLPALADCEFILRYFPNHPRALIALAEICLAWKNPRCNADPFFEQAIALNPRQAATFATKGIYLLRANRVDEAIEALKQAAALDPGSVNAQYNLGLAYLEAKQYELANRHAQLAYQLGAPVPGLRERLKRAGQWKPEAVAPEQPAAEAPKGQSGNAARQ